MIIQVYDEFLTADECQSLIDFYQDNKHQSFELGNGEEGRFPRWPLVITETAASTHELRYKLNQKTLNANDSVIDYIQIVRWPIGSKQNPHYDVADHHTDLASIIYLNDNFIGGETYFTDGIIFTPRQGRLILFDGQYYEHGVHEVQTHERYVVAAWYKKEAKRFERRIWKERRRKIQHMERMSQ